MLNVIGRTQSTQTDPDRATLPGADLRGADLRGADLRGASLTGADLRGADLEGVIVDHEQWIFTSGALFDAGKWTVSRSNSDASVGAIFLYSVTSRATSTKTTWSISRPGSRRTNRILLS